MHRQPMRPTYQRACPKCGSLASGLMCPVDGFATVPIEASEGTSLTPGTRVLSQYVVDAFVDRDPGLANYRAHDKASKTVRLAVVTVPRSAPEFEVERMIGAAQALERLQHKAIAKIYATGVIDSGDLAIVSEHLEGVTLEDAMRKPLGSERAMDLGIELLAALEAAHDQGIAHHNLSPARVRLAGDRVVVTDFGIADILRAPDAVFDDGPRGAMYRAPERARATNVTRHADIYSVGAILFEVLTGKSAVDLELLKEAKVETPLAEFVVRCLEKKPWNRYDTATLARKALEAARDAVEQAGPLGRATMTELDWQAPRAEALSRETTRPVDAMTSGLLTPGFGPTQEPSAPVVVAQDTDTVAPIARPMVRYVKPRRQAWWLVAAALALIASGIGIAMALMGGDDPQRMVAALNVEQALPLVPAARLAEQREAEVQAAAEAEAKERAALAEAEAKAKADAEAKAKAEAAAKVEAEAEALIAAHMKAEPEILDIEAVTVGKPEVKVEAKVDPALKVDVTKVDGAKVEAVAPVAKVEPAKVEPKKKTWQEIQAEEQAAQRAAARARADATAKAKAERDAKAVADKRVADEAKAARDAAWKVKREAQEREQAEAQAQRDAERDARRAAKLERERVAKVERERVERETLTPAKEDGNSRALLSTTPSGASVLVDGALVGKTPMTLVWKPGVVRHVWVMLEGHTPTGFDVGDAQNGKMLRLELSPLAPKPDDALPQ